MAMQGPTTQVEMEAMDISVEQKTPDFKAPARFKNAPEEWVSAGLAQYNPFSSTKYDADSFAIACQEWQSYSDSFMSDVNNERYTTNEAEREQLNELNSLKQILGAQVFVQNPSMSRALNEKCAHADGFDETFKNQLEKIQAHNQNSDISAARQHNLAKTADSKFANQAIHPAARLQGRINHGDALNAPLDKNQVLKDAGASINKDAKTGKEVQTGVCSQFSKQPKPVINAFKNKIINNWRMENQKANDSFAAEQMQELSLASKIRSNKPTSYANAARRSAKP